VSGGRAAARTYNFQTREEFAAPAGGAVGRVPRAADDAGLLPAPFPFRSDKSRRCLPQLYKSHSASPERSSTCRGQKNKLQTSKTKIVAVNKDSEAPIFELAEFSGGREPVQGRFSAS